MYKICFYVPMNFANQVKEAMFLAGAGRIGNYDQCCFESHGIGQFRPLVGSNPALGIALQLEKVEESRIEMVCEDQLIKAVIVALKKNHPYETPAFDVIKLIDEF